VCCRLRHHDEDARVVLCLELLDDVSALGRGHAAVDGGRCVPGLDDPLLQHLQRVPVRHKDQHFLVRASDYIQQFVHPITHVELHHVPIIGVHRTLRDLQELVEHGQWEDWLENSVGFSPSTARRYMQISREYGEISKSATLRDLSYSNALRLLAVPEEDREEFVEDNDVENMTVKELEQKIKNLESVNSLSEAKAQKLEEDLKKSEKDIESFSQREKDLVDQLNEIKETTPGGISESAQAEIDKIRMEKLEEIKAIAKEKEAAETKAEKLKSQLEQQKKDQEQIVAKEREKAAEEAKTEAKKEFEEEIQNLMETADKANKAKMEAEKKLAISSDQDLTQISFLAKQIGQQLSELPALLKKIEEKDNAQAKNIRNGLKASFEKLIEQL